MKKKEHVIEKKKLNITALFSFLIVLFVPALFLIPWSQLFILRSDLITTIFIHVTGLFAIGFFMLVLGIIAIVLARKRKGIYKGNWLGVLGVVIGGILFLMGGFFIIEYLINT